MTLREVYLSARKLEELLRTEADGYDTYERSLSRRLWLWRRGFLSRSDYLYDLNEQTHRQYLSDVERFLKTKQINGQWAITLDNKLFCHWMLQPFDNHRPAVYGLLKNGRFHPIDTLHPIATDGGSSAKSDVPDGVTAEGHHATDAAERVPALLRRESRLVLKWIKGGGGNNVRLCRWDDGAIVVNGERMSPEAFGRSVADYEEYLVCEFVEQSDFGAQLFPETPNTLRVITMYDADAGEPFVPIAIQRMGSERSLPMDNFSQGGLNAELDVETGTLGKAVQLPESTRLVWHETHPDTGTVIAGQSVPGWEAIHEKLLEIAAAFPYVPYVGWDIVPTDANGGFDIIEANSYPGAKALQVHRPLLADDRVRRFYETQDALVWTRSG